MNNKMLVATLRRRVLKSAIVSTLALACGTASDPARAGLPVIDYTAATQWWQEYAEKIAEWTATATHYKSVIGHQIKEVKQWEAQLNDLRQLKFEMFKVERTFETVSEDFGVEVECHAKASSGGLSSVLDMTLDQIIPDMNGNVIEQQRKLCIQIVQARNIKYNNTVNYLKFVARKSERDDRNPVQIGRGGKRDAGQDGRAGPADGSI